MAIDWSLAPKISGSDYLGPLHAMELGRQARAQELQQTARKTALQQYTQGDAAGAQQTATAAGDFDLADHLAKSSADHRAQLAAVYTEVGRTAYGLKGITDPQARQAAFDAQAPRLKALGVPDDVIANQRGHLDNDSLDSVATQSMSVLDQIKRHDELTKPVTLIDGAELHDPQSGAVIASNDKQAKWQFDPQSGSWLQEPGTGGLPNGGLPPGAPGVPQPPAAPNGQGAPVVKRANGWTPRARDGGDNSDAAVDGKLASLQHATGFPIDAPLTPGQVGHVIGAIPLTEGGKGSIADRNNNPSNIRDGDFARSQPGYIGSEGGFAKFANPQAGMQAAQALGARYYSRGQRTIRDIIEGSPVGGGQPQAQSPASPGVINVRPPKGKEAPSGYQFDASGTNLTPIPGGPADTGNNPKTNLQNEIQFRKEFDQLPEVKSFKTARQQFQTVRALANKPNPNGQDDIALIFSYMKTLDPNSTVREGEFSTAQNSGSIPQSIANAYNKALQGTRLNPEQRQGMARAAYQSYKTFRDAYNTSAENYRGYARDTGINPDHVARTYTPDAPTRSGGAPVQVKSPQEAMSLKPGTLYVAPDGVTRRR